MGRIHSNLKKSLRRILPVSLSALILTPLTVYAATISAPSVKLKYNGAYNLYTSPPSTTIAVSPDREFQLINGKYEIVDRSKNVLGSGDSSQFVNGANVFMSDPQVLWDPTSSRFYFSLFENRGTSTPDEGILWGFSKTATPVNASDFCTYFNGFDFGANSFPDRHSLGDTSDFLIFSSDRFGVSGDGFLGATADYVSKPLPGSTCPAQSTFKSGTLSNATGTNGTFTYSKIVNPDGSDPYSPSVSKQVDNSSTGWILATPSIASASSITAWQVTKNTDGSAKISVPNSVSVPYYSGPPYAPQGGTQSNGQPAINLETRIYFSQVYMAIDPRFGQYELWTADTVYGGAGSKINWYEINASTLKTDQVGSVSDPSLYLFNATIAPDRIVNGPNKTYGSDMVVTFNSSSSTTYPAIKYVAKEGSLPQSTIKTLKTTTGPNIDFSCFEPYQNYCRWGDYSGTAPDEGAPTSGVSTGQVWLSNEWNKPSATDQDVDWRTLISDVKP